MNSGLLELRYRARSCLKKTERGEGRLTKLASRYVSACWRHVRVYYDLLVHWHGVITILTPSMALNLGGVRHLENTLAEIAYGSEGGREDSTVVLSKGTTLSCTIQKEQFSRLRERKWLSRQRVCSSKHMPVSSTLDPG